jgi:FtsP/CotA-like multicopper oxidase with cupredoxin domain
MEKWETRQLPEPTTINWHGMQVPNDMAGIPDVTQTAVEPGKSFSYEFTAGHPGTYMYHSMYDDMKQVRSGLYGAVIIDPKKPNSEEPSSDPQEMNTLSIGPGEMYDVAFKADALGTWLFQCHILDHTMNAEDRMHMGGLVTMVKVVE